MCSSKELSAANVWAFCPWTHANRPAPTATRNTAANPINDKRGTIAYRKTVSGVLTKRAARIAYDRAKERN